MKSLPHSTADDLYLAIDQGGHASRALVFDGRGRLQAEALAEIATRHPTLDRVEHDPEELLQSVRTALDEIRHRLGPATSRIKAAGLATQRSSIVCWDRQTGTALSPVLSWQDRRAADWLASYAERTAEIHARTGLRLSPHYGVSKLRWCLDHLPSVGAALHAGRLAWGPLASFLLFRLLDERPLMADPANASRTLLWDYRRLDWSSELLACFALPRAPLPQCVPSRHRFGTLRLGRHAVPLAVTTGDQSAALYAGGRPAADALYANIGTGAFVQRLLLDADAEPGPLLAGVVYSDGREVHRVLEGTVNGAGSALEWLRQGAGLGHAALQVLLGSALSQEAEPPLFLNGISGLGSPYWVADFESRFVGTGDIQGRVSAVLESIVFLLAVNSERLSLHPPRPGRILASGGLTVQDRFCQRLADVAGLPVIRPALREATARGLAFLLAGCPVEWPTDSAPDRFEPRPDPALRQRFARWRAAMENAVGKFGESSD